MENFGYNGFMAKKGENQRLEGIRDAIRAFPTGPGLYFMKDAEDKVLYIGKAKNLRNRAGSYFQPGANLAESRGPWIVEMIGKTTTVEYIQTDIYVRFLRLIGRDVIYCCADDAHGTAIEMSAAKTGQSPAEMIERVHAEHLRDFQGYLIQFDSYYTTHSPENEHQANRIFQALHSRGDIVTRSVERTFCASCSRFLPDRYVRGTCPRCGAPVQHAARRADDFR